MSKSCKQVLATVLALMVVPVFAHFPGVTVTSNAVAAPPTIDGVLSPGEWSEAGALPFSIQSTTGTMFVMHDATNLYVAVVVNDSSLGSLNSLALIFDNSNKGTLGAGDDALVANLGSMAFDDFFNGSCCFLFDSNDGGTNDIQAIGSLTGTQAVWELRHPLCSADRAHDFCLAPGAVAGFNIVYQPGSGSFYAGFPSFAPYDASQFADLRIAAATQKVDIDIRPGRFPNVIDLGSDRPMVVAVLSSPTFDAPAAIDRTSLTFGRTGDEKTMVECRVKPKDVNGDRLGDLVCRFDGRRAGFTVADTMGTLKGITRAGTSIQGVDSIRIVTDDQSKDASLDGFDDVD
jgi:hypothetical protein